MSPIWTPGGRHTSGQIDLEFAELNDARRAGYCQRNVTIDLATCCHCGRDFKISRGSGRRRGYCLAHDAVTCGRRTCARCPLSTRKP